MGLRPPTLGVAQTGRRSLGRADGTSSQCQGPIQTRIASRKTSVPGVASPGIYTSEIARVSSVCKVTFTQPSANSSVNKTPGLFIELGVRSKGAFKKQTSEPFPEASLLSRGVRTGRQESASVTAPHALQPPWALRSPPCVPPGPQREKPGPCAQRMELLPLHPGDTAVRAGGSWFTDGGPRLQRNAQCLEGCRQGGRGLGAKVP